jgi:hypothetical protein
MSKISEHRNVIAIPSEAVLKDRIVKIHFEAKRQLPLSSATRDKNVPSANASVFHATEYAQQRCKNALRLALDPTVLFCALAQKTQVLGGPSNQGELGNLGISQNTLSEI